MADASFEELTSVCRAIILSDICRLSLSALCVNVAHSIDVAIPNTRNLHSTISEKLQKCTDLKEELVKTRQLNTTYVIPPVLSTGGVTPNA